MVTGHSDRTLGILTLHKIVGRFKFSAKAPACPNIEDVQILGGKSPSLEAVSFLSFKGSLGWEREVWQTQ